MSLGSLAFQEDYLGQQAMQLVDLLAEVRDVLNRSFRDAIWIIAEVSNLSFNAYSGHCYMDLVQNEAGVVLAKTKATLFAGVASKVLPRFQSVTGTSIDNGMQLMLLVKVSHSPQWGFALNILDINPEYTLGQHERIKQETIQKLRADGIWDLNKSHHLPMLLQRIAVISSETAAGLGDFMRQIEQSAVGGLMRLEVFPALMQGQLAPKSISEALLSIFHRIDDFDAVVIIRGGGSKLDLAAFDEYNLCCYVANFPGPIITGIGHERDESVVDMVAHTSLKTPTAVAEFLIRRMEQVVLQIFEAEERLEGFLTEFIDQRKDEAEKLTQLCSHSLLSLEKQAEVQLNSFSAFLQEHLRVLMLQEMNFHERLDHRLRHSLDMMNNNLEQRRGEIKQRGERLERMLLKLEDNLNKSLDQYEKMIRLQDPRQIMKRGFLPIRHEGKTIASVEGLAKGDSLEIIMLDGVVTSEVSEIIAND